MNLFIYLGVLAFVWILAFVVLGVRMVQVDKARKQHKKIDDVAPSDGVIAAFVIATIVTLILTLYYFLGNNG